MKQRNRLTICLVAGVLILAVSATAAFGSVNGYSRYKEALKALALKSDNFTANVTMTMTHDGKEIARNSFSYAMDGVNTASHSRSSEPNRKTYEEFDTLYQGVRTWYTSDEAYYYQTEYDREAASVTSNLLGVSDDDEMSKRLVNFAEIAADTVVGELKNNFVQLSKENGLTNYRVEIAKNQVPSLINAGLSLFAYGVDQNNGYTNTVQFENYSASVLANYEKSTGTTLPKEFKEGYIGDSDGKWYEEHEELLTKVDEFNSDSDWESTYYDMLAEKKNGIVYVKTDGSYDYYADYDAFAAAHPDMVSGDLNIYVGQDMALESVLCDFSVDDQGRLASNKITVTFSTTDRKGGHHTLVATVDAKVTDYGTTTVQPLDVGNRTKYEFKN